jgi:hypothetical protein
MDAANPPFRALLQRTMPGALLAGSMGLVLDLAQRGSGLLELPAK